MNATIMVEHLIITTSLKPYYVHFSLICSDCSLPGGFEGKGKSWLVIAGAGALPDGAAISPSSGSTASDFAGSPLRSAGLSSQHHSTIHAPETHDSEFRHTPYQSKQRHKRANPNRRTRDSAPGPPRVFHCRMLRQRTAWKRRTPPCCPGSSRQLASHSKPAYGHESNATMILPLL